MSSSGRAGYQARDPEQDAVNRRPPPAAAADAPAPAAGPLPPLPSDPAALTRGRRSPAGAARQAGMLLGLQRTAGNAYVQRLFGGTGRPARAGAEPAAPARPGNTEANPAGHVPTDMSPDHHRQGGTAEQPAQPASDRTTPSPLIPGAGAPLPDAVRTPLESALSADFSAVRVHTGPEAAASAASFNARAYTTGRDIVFGDGAFAPDTSAGRERLAHELTHVQQQAAGPVAGAAGGGVRVSHPSDPFEQEAAHTAARVRDGTAAEAPTGAVLRDALATAPLSPAQHAAGLDLARTAEVGDAARAAARPGGAGGPLAHAYRACAAFAGQRLARAGSPLLGSPGGSVAVQRLVADPAKEGDTATPAQQDAAGPATAERAADGTPAPASRPASGGPMSAQATAAAIDPANLAPGSGDAERVANDIYRCLAMPNPAAHTEEILQALLTARGRGDEVVATYQTKFGQDLLPALDAALAENDAIRVRRYLQYGTLRLADKIFFAARGAGTDEDTLFRLMRDARGALEAAEADFIKDYGSFCAADGTLPDGRKSRLAGLLDEELSGADLAKAKAILAYGEPRPADRIRMATAGAGTDEAMLFSALEAANRATIHQEYQAAYGQDLDALVQSELSGAAHERAVQTLAGRFDTMAKLRYAAGGFGTDEAMIFDTLSRLPAEEKAALARQFADHSSELYLLLDGDLSSSDMDRAAAILAGGRSMADALKQAGAVDGDAIVSTIKMTSGEKYESYRRAYLEDDPAFWGYVRPLVDGEQMRSLRLMLTGTPEQRLRHAIEGTYSDDEDYVFHVLEHFTTDEDRRRIAADTALMAELEAALSTSDMNRVRGLLTPGSRTLQERVADVNTRVGRERSWVADAFSNASDALADEQRELNAALTIARGDRAVSEAEQTEIQARLGLTEGALDVYISVRDELEETTATILTTAAGILIAVATGGLASGASAAMIAAALAKAAVASAITRVVVTKIAKGERFDIMGADGAIAFGAGAIDGVMNVVGAGAAQKVLSPLLGAAVREATVAATESAFETVGKTLLLKAAEGSLSGAASSLFESAANESTWKGGIEAGVTNVLISTGTSAGMGAGMSVGLHVAGEGGAALLRGRAPHTGGGPDGHVTGERADVTGEAAGGAADLAGDAVEVSEARIAAPDQSAGLPEFATDDSHTIPSAAAVDEPAMPNRPAADSTLPAAPAIEDQTLPGPLDQPRSGSALEREVTQPGALAGPEIVIRGGEGPNKVQIPAARIAAQAVPAMPHIIFDPRLSGLDIDAVLARMEATPDGARLAEIIRTGTAPTGEAVRVQFVRPEDLPGAGGSYANGLITVAFRDPDQAARVLVHEGTHFIDPAAVGGVQDTRVSREAIARAFEFEWARARNIEVNSPAFTAAREAYETVYADVVLQRISAGDDIDTALATAAREANIAADRALVAELRANPARYVVETPEELQQRVEAVRAQGGTLDDVLGTNPQPPAGFLPPESALEESWFGDLFRGQGAADATTRTSAAASTLADQPPVTDSDLATTPRLDESAASTEPLPAQPGGQGGGGGGGSSSPPGTIPDPGSPTSEGSTLPATTRLDSTIPNAAPAGSTVLDGTPLGSTVPDTTRPGSTESISTLDATHDAVTQLFGPAGLQPGQQPPARVLNPADVVSDTAISEGINAGKRKLVMRDGRVYIFKPAAGEAPIIGEHEGIVAGERYRRGPATAELAGQAGFAAPGTEIASYKGETGQLQEWVSGHHIYTMAELELADPAWEQAIQQSQMKKDLDTFDYLIANMDRNPGNLLVELDPVTGDIKRLIPIDMDAAFPPSDVRYTLGPGPVEPWQMPLPDLISARLEQRLRHMAANRDALRHALGLYLTPAEVEGTLARLDHILQEVDAGAIQVAP